MQGEDKAAEQSDEKNARLKVSQPAGSSGLEWQWLRRGYRS